MENKKQEPKKEQKPVYTQKSAEAAYKLLKKAHELRKLALGLGIIVAATGCMQLTGLQEFDAWGFKGKSTTGFEVSAGVQQFDHVLDRKGINVEKMDNRKLEKY